MTYSDNALVVYKKLYYSKVFNETCPENVHERVAKFISNNKEEYNHFLNMMNNNIFRPNTPTLINAGSTSDKIIDTQLMACFILGLEDTMDSIIDMWSIASKIYASGAGIGVNITNLREKGSPISGGGEASGALAYLKILEIVSQTVRSGGRNRRSANLGVFTYDHPDTISILDAKQSGKELQSFNVSILLDDKFLKNVSNNKPFEVDLKSPNPLSGFNNKSKFTVNGFNIWNKVVFNAWTTGDPGTLFYDTINKFNPFPSKGDIDCANACSEICLPSWNACVLGAINLTKCISTDSNYLYHFDVGKFKKYVKWGTIFLDNIIDKTSYIHPNFERVMKENRSIGLGFMGFADTLVQLRIEYGSYECNQLIELISKEMTLTSIRTSIEMCKNGKTPIDIPPEDLEHFTNLLEYYGCNENDLENFDEFGIRNCTWTCCQPTGSTSISADCSYSFEPIMAIVWDKELSDTNEVMHFVYPPFEKWLNDFVNEKFSGMTVPIEFNNQHENSKNKYKEEIYNKIINNHGSVQGIEEIPIEIQKIFKTAHDIDPYKKIDVQAAAQRYISLGMSSTCNLPNGTTQEEIEKIYLYAWKKGLKGITIYRDGCREWQPVNFGKKEEPKSEVVESLTINEFKPEKKRPIRRNGNTYEIPTPYGKLYVIVNKYEDEIKEVFLNLGNQGSHVNLLYDQIARQISKSLQNGTSIDEVISMLRSNKEAFFTFRLVEDSCEPFRVESTLEAIGVVLQHEHMINENIKQEKVWMEEYQKDLLEEKKVNQVYIFDICPACGKPTLNRASGCKSGSCVNSECLYTSCS